MPSGGDILGAMDRLLDQLRRDADTLDTQFRRTADDLANAQRAELAAFAGLARLRLDEIAGGELLRCFDDTGRQVADVLKVREAAEKVLEGDLAAAESALAAAESERTRQVAAVVSATQAADEAAKQAQEWLAANEVHAAELGAAREAQSIAEHAEAKAAAAEEDRLLKSEPYDADPVFRYLWERGFGTAAYRSSSLLRSLDGVVARASSYERLRRNYWLLHEIPRRLAEHARRMRAKADESLAAARLLETHAAERAAVPAKQRALGEAQQRLAETDRAIEQHEAALDAAKERRARFAAGEDEHSARCAELLVQALKRADMHELRKKAARTATEDDDRFIAELERLGHERERVQQERIRLRRLHQAHRERVLALEEVRRRFKQSRYDDVHSEFANAASVTTLLERFAAGSVGRDELWNGIVRQAVKRSAAG